AARGVTHTESFAIVHDDPGMKHVKILASRDKTNHIAALQLRRGTRHRRLGYASHMGSLLSESGYGTQDTFPAVSRHRRNRKRFKQTFAHVVANPVCHVVIAPFPFNATVFIPNLSQPLDEFIHVRGARQGKNRFDIRDTVETIERRREHFAGVGRTNQRIWLVGISKKMARDEVNSAMSETFIPRFR